MLAYLGRVHVEAFTYALMVVPMVSSVVKSSKVKRTTPSMAEPAPSRQRPQHMVTTHGQRLLQSMGWLEALGIACLRLPSEVVMSSETPLAFCPVVTGSSPLGHISVGIRYGRSGMS